MMLIAFLVACSGTKVIDDSGVVTDDSADSGHTGETDSGETGETGESGETGTPGPDLIFNVSGSYSGAVLSLTWLDATSLGSDELTLGDVLVSVTATETTGIVAGTPPDDVLMELSPDAAPGMLGAFYVPSLYQDDDGDATHDEDELWLGVGLDWPLYLTGTIPRELLEQGFQAGWNALHFTTSDTEPELVDPLAIPLTTNLLPTETLTLGGTWAASVGPEGYGLFLAAYPAFEGETVEAWLYDGPAESDWSVTLDGEPPEDHFAVLDFLGAPGALEVPIAYEDADGGGTFSFGDTAVFAACQDGAPVGALWLPPTGDQGLALTLAIQGLAPGWLAVSVADSVGLPDPERLDELELSESCALE